MASYDDVIDLRITMPEECQVSLKFMLAKTPDIIGADYTGVWNAMRRIKDGAAAFYMSALDPERHPGLSAMIRDEKYAELRQCALAQHDLVYWEKPFRVDDDWCSPSFLTDQGEAALDAATKGYSWSLKDRCISQQGTRDHYCHKLRWNDHSAMKTLDGLDDDWLADLRRCIEPVRRGYCFSPLLEAIDIDLTIKRYMPASGSAFMSQNDFKTVRAMNDPRMDEVLTKMSWLIITSESRKVMTPSGIMEDGWVLSETSSLTFD